VASLTKKFSSTKDNYGNYKEELLAIVTAFKKWAHYLRKAKQTIEVQTDHHNLQYFRTVSTDKLQQSCWAIKLEVFNINIKLM
jgi:hypothetical protein